MHNPVAVNRGLYNQPYFYILLLSFMSLPMNVSVTTSVKFERRWGKCVMMHNWMSNCCEISERGPVTVKESWMHVIWNADTAFLLCGNKNILVMIVKEYSKVFVSKCYTYPIWNVVVKVTICDVATCYWFHINFILHTLCQYKLRTYTFEPLQ